MIPPINATLADAVAVPRRTTPENPFLPNFHEKNLRK